MNLSRPNFIIGRQVASSVNGSRCRHFSHVCLPPRINGNENTFATCIVLCTFSCTCSTTPDHHLRAVLLYISLEPLAALPVEMTSHLSDVMRRNQLNDAGLSHAIYSNHQANIVRIVTLCISTFSVTAGLLAVFWFMRMQRHFRHS